MTHIDDTTLINRSFDPSSIKYVQSKAQSVLDAEGIYTDTGLNLVNELNKDLVDLNISPSDSADLAAVSCFWGATMASQSLSREGCQVLFRKDVERNAIKHLLNMGVQQCVISVGVNLVHSTRHLLSKRNLQALVI